MAEIGLTRGYTTTVDDEDYEWLSQWSWYALPGRGLVYAARSEKRRTLLMHRAIAGTPPDKKTDHIDRDTLNNRKSNLRICSTQENARNAGLNSNNASGYKGVVWYKPTRRWLATIRHNRRQIHLGYFASREEAAIAYDAAAREYFGSFAYLNFPDDTEVIVGNTADENRMEVA